MKDDGQGSSIRIPSFEIGKRDGDVIKEAVTQLKINEIEKEV